MNALAPTLAPAPISAAGVLGAGLDPGTLIALITSDDGLEIRDHFHHFRRCRACFRGDALVSFLAARLGLSRGQALEAARRLEQLQHVRAVDGVRGFSDSARLFGIGPGPLDAERLDAELSIEALAELAQTMRDPAGVRAGSRYFGLVRYPGSFSGHEAVVWIAAHCQVSTLRAVQIGQAMLRANFIRHVFDEAGFDDNTLLYQFV